MGTKYSTLSVSGYNASPPPDDNSTGADNQVTWAKHKTKLSDPIKTFSEAINSALVTAFDYSVRQITSSASTAATDHMKTVEVGATSNTVTVSLADAATMTSNYIVRVKNSSVNAITVGRATVGDTIDGAAANVTLQPGQAAIFTTNSGANGYLMLGTVGYTKNLTVTGAATIGSTLAVTGAATVGGTLTVTGALTNSALISDRLPLIGAAGLITSLADFTYQAANGGNLTILARGSSLYTASLRIWNEHATASAYLNAQAEGGDAFSRYDVDYSGATVSWATGIDNSDSDSYKICASALIGTSDIAKFTTTGSAVLNATGSALATNATDGFTYIPTCAGTPTGVPTAYTGAAALVVNTTNNKLYFYSGGAWRDAGP